MFDPGDGTGREDEGERSEVPAWDPRQMTAAATSGIFSPLRYRDYRYVAIGTLASLLGDGLFRVAIGLQVLSALGRGPAALAAVAVVWSSGQILLLPLGGWVTDRFERRKVMIAADMWRGGVMLVIGALSVSGNLELWHLLVLGGAFGAGNAFFNPAATSLVPDLLPDHELARANAFLGVARPLMLYIVGPLCGASVITFIGVGSAFLVDGVTYFFSACLLLLVTARKPGGAAAESMRATLHEAAEGWRFVRRTPWAWSWLLAAALSTLAWHGPFDVLVPFLLVNDLALGEGAVSRVLAAIFVAGGLGSIAVSLRIGRRSLPRRFVTTIYVSEATGLLAIAVFGVIVAPWQAVVAGLVLLSAFTLTEIVWTTMLQRLVPRAMLGRVASLDWLTGIGLAPVSFAVAGPLGAMLGARTVLVGSGILGAASVLGLLLVPGARRPERERSLDATVAERDATVLRESS